MSYSPYLYAHIYAYDTHTITIIKDRSLISIKPLILCVVCHHQNMEDVVLLEALTNTPSVLLDSNKANNLPLFGDAKHA